MLVAEVASSGADVKVLRAEEFVYPGDRTLREPEPLGDALGHFLKENHFSARTAVFGLPARWVLSKRKEVPSDDPRVLADTLRLQAETEFSPELSDLVYDYSRQSATAAPKCVLLLAVSRKHVEQLSKLAGAAKLRVQAVMPAGAALAAAMVRSSPEGMALLLGAGGVEFAAQQEGSPRVLRYVGAATAPAPLLAGELRRAAAFVSQNGKGLTNGHAHRELMLFNDAGADETCLRAVGSTLGVALKDGALSDLGVDAAGFSRNGRTFAAPVSLALAGLSPKGPAIDFAHSRLAPRPEQKIDRRTVLSIAAAVMVVLGIGYWFYDLHSRQSAYDRQRAEYNGNQKQRDDATKFVTKVGYAGQWHRQTPDVIACLRDITMAFPEGGQLYATTLNLHEDMKGTLMGKAPDGQAVEEVQRNLQNKKPKSGGRFEDVTLVQMEAHDSARGGHEVAFTIAFNYLPQP